MSEHMTEQELLDTAFNLTPWDRSARGVIREALRDCVGDGDGIDELILATFVAEVKAEVLIGLFGDDFDPETWEIYHGEEGGQANGSGVLERSDYREWFTEESETHHRGSIELVGPWVIGPTAQAQATQARAKREKEARKTVREAFDRETYERLKAKFEPLSRTGNDT